MNLITECLSCNKKLYSDTDGWLQAVRIQRGNFFVSFDADECFEVDEGKTNVKYDAWLCNECYLNNEDLCRFFNSKGMRMR